VAWTQVNLDALDAAIAKGEKRVSFGDRTVEYRSLDEMLRARGVIQAELDNAAVVERPRQRLAYHAGKGL
jgi:hypothetical protein